MSVLVIPNCSSRRNRFIIFAIATSICIVFYDYMISIYNNYNIIKNMDIPRKYIEDALRDALKEDKGTGCKIPYLDPFAKEITKFDEPKPEITCPGLDWVKCYLSECRVVDEILETTMDIVCYYQDIIYVTDHNYYLGPATEVFGHETYILNRSDHVKIKCNGAVKKRSLLSIFKMFGLAVYRATSWVGYSLGFRTSVERRPVPPKREDTLNILIYAFDSTSRNLFIRKLPKSYDYLKNHINATILNGYNIVGDGTPAALFPILTGQNELELPDVRKVSKTNITVDSLPFIFYKLREDGYRTAYFEDMPNIGTFQYRFTGFLRQPVDHYLRALFLLQQETNSLHCMGDTPHFKLMINITEQFLQLDGKKFCFTFIGGISHDDYTLIGNADDATLNLFKTLVKRNTFEDTIFIVMGDHGSRFSTIRNTLQGKLEERLPFMGIRLPDRLKRARPDAQVVLEQNAEALTTPYDIHTTLLDVLDWPQHMNHYKVDGADLPRGMSLLEAIPKNRSCSEAGIQLHWCACVEWDDVTEDETMSHKLAEAFVHYINELTESVRSFCVPRYLLRIEWVKRQRPNNRMLSFLGAKDGDGYLGSFDETTKFFKETYQLKVIVGPGYGMFEASITHVKNHDKFLIDYTGISRTNEYGSEPACISGTHPHLNKYCHCKDYNS